MLPALLLIPLVALFRILLAWQPANSSLHSWFLGCTPLAAVALCAGVFLPRRLALAIPLGVLLLSDAIIDAHYGFRFFSVFTLVNYALLALVGLGGMSLRRSAPRATGLPKVLGATLAASVFFYVASNFSVWLSSAEYPQTAAGFWQALTVGLPGYPPSYVFFRNELVSDLLYSMVFVACVRLTQPARNREPITAPPTVAAGSDALLSGARHQG